MTKAQNKKQRRGEGGLKVVVVNVAMATIALTAAVVLLLVAMGYKFDLNGQLGRTGLVQVDSLPNGAVVSLDGIVQSMRTSFSKNVDAGWHTVTVSMDGYDIWTKSADVKPGMVTRLNYARLFPLDRQVTEVRDLGQIYQVSAPERRQFILVMQTHDQWELVDIRTNTPRFTKISIAPVFEAQVLKEAKEVAIAKWSDDGQKVLIRLTRADGQLEWAVMDLTQPEKALNLNREFSLGFSRVVLADGSGNTVFTLDGGNLRRADVGTKTITSVIESGVQTMSAYAGRVAYTRVTDDGQRLVGVWRQGADGELVVTKLAAGEGAVGLAQADYRGRSWIAYVSGGQIRVYDGQTDKIGRDESVAPIVSQDLQQCEPELTVGGLGRLIQVRCDGATRMVDLNEPETLHLVDKTDATARWLDDYMLYLQDGKDTYAIDFDGSNGRWILPTAGHPVVVSADDNWMYYVEFGEDGAARLVREALQI
jgi:hypothetical protein